MKMFCGNCLESVPAKTLSPGSDWIEFAGWCCGLVPGLVYCAWRHATRRRVCPRCGNANLIYETRAAQRRRRAAAPPTSNAQPHFQKPWGHWPHAFATPRQRVRIGGIATATLALLLGFGVLTMQAVGTTQRWQAKSQRAAKIIVAKASELIGVDHAAEAPKDTLAKSRACWSQCGSAYAESDVARIRTCVAACVYDRNPETQVTRTEDACGASLDPNACAKFVGNF